MFRATRLTLITAVTGLGLLAQAPPPGFPPPCPPEAGGRPGCQGPQGPHGPGPDRLLKALALTPQQSAAIHAAMARHRSQSEAARRNALEQEESLRAAADDPAIPESQVKALHAGISEARLKDLLDHRALVLEINALLTPEQQAKAARIRDDQAKARAAHLALRADLGEPER